MNKFKNFIRKVLPKNFKNNLAIRIKVKLEMILLILLGKKLILISYVDHFKKNGDLEGIKATCKVAGMTYSSAITTTDQFIVNEKVQMTNHEKITLRTVIETYGNMIRVVKDDRSNKAYFDRVGMIVLLPTKTYKHWVVVNKPDRIEQMMNFAGSIKLHYA